MLDALNERFLRPDGRPSAAAWSTVAGLVVAAFLGGFVARGVNDQRGDPAGSAAAASQPAGDPDAQASRPGSARSTAVRLTRAAALPSLSQPPRRRVAQRSGTSAPVDAATPAAEGTGPAPAEDSPSVLADPGPARSAPPAPPAASAPPAQAPPARPAPAPPARPAPAQPARPAPSNESFDTIG